jgi:hypothetical protein
VTARQITEAKPVKPLSPAKATKRADKLRAAQQRLADLKAQGAIRIQAARRKLADI